ncbi:hypothetical protein M422DRAFT_785529 [Sphaerobolus stellatus SS14]|uniref:Uncharacterized protein n=1 Tax=Sphaerobolus stellatus (strain SS14) TaxID=990650 RepID=A0A0C9T911_SPHS4|nr:hypothetical protein M422DRAFT_785529 [Sphaerobolus stellatus SS14]
MPQLTRIPSDIWHRIFLYLAESVGTSGPPSTIIPMVLVNRWMHSILCICSAGNSHLYANIFDDYFDSRSPRLRLGYSRTTSSARAAELVNRFSSMARIRQGDIHYDGNLITQDVFRCFFMLLESDWKNAKLLMGYARLRDFTYRLAISQFGDNDDDSHLQSDALRACLLWVLWMISSNGSLIFEDEPLAIRLQDGVLPYAISAWLFNDYPPLRNPYPSDVGTYSESRTTTGSQSFYSIPMFSHLVTFVIPPISPVAILSFCARADACLLRYSHNADPSNSHPGNESIDRARRVLSSSVAGLEEFSSHTSSHTDPSYRPSNQFQDDWARLQCTFQTSGGPSETGASAINTRRLITLLSGIWEGRIEHPNYSQYMALRDSQRPSPSAYESLFMTSLPLLFHLTIFYSSSAEESLRLNLEGDGILNAWFPPDYEVEINYMRSGELRIWDRAENKMARYSPFVPELGLAEDEKIDDVIIIGNSTANDTRYIGRVRLSDGLIVLLRDPIQTGRELLRGYIHHSDVFVGRWRTAASPADADNWEGPFVLGHRDELPRTS